jgi:hypothetical protein
MIGSGPYQLTVWDSPDSILEGSQWGTLTYRAWCEKEAARIRAGGRRADVQENFPGGRIAVFVDLARLRDFFPQTP